MGILLHKPGWGLQGIKQGTGRAGPLDFPFMEPALIFRVSPIRKSWDGMTYYIFPLLPEKGRSVQGESERTMEISPEILNSCQDVTGIDSIAGYSETW